MRLSGVPFIRRTVVLGITGSTNDDARALAEDGAPEGTVVIAQGQRKGRGRLGRSWESPAGMGCYVSILLRPVEAPERLAWYGLAAGVATAEACRSLAGEHVALKWPNDVLASGKKLAGILTESRQGRHGVELIVGIGVNVRQAPGDLPGPLADTATSLLIESGGGTVDCEGTAAAVLSALVENVRVLRAGGAPAVAERFLRYAPSVSGGSVRLKSGTTGVTRGLDATGALIVDTASGPTLVHTGESVTFL